MAKFEILTPATEDSPASAEMIEVRVWGQAGKAYQGFVLGTGMNFQAHGNFWLEIRYTVSDVPIFTTRTFLHDTSEVENLPNVIEYFHKFERGEVDSFGFGEMFPESGLSLKRSRYTWQNQQGEDQPYESYTLEIAADVGLVYNLRESPGQRFLKITCNNVDGAEGMRFLSDLLSELEAAMHGRRPDPRGLPPGANDWPFARELNRRAYAQLASTYQEQYFENPLLERAFLDWLDCLPPGAAVLDAGCGHGNPVIGRLVERGLRVTGSDDSPAMLERARQQFPQVTFLQRAVSEIEEQEQYDAACSFSSLLYLDPLDLLPALYRLHCALKPGGLLFLHSYDLHPSWRGNPYDLQMNQWMWSWTYGMEEIAEILQEHGLFEVQRSQDVTTDEEKEKRVIHWRESEQRQYEELRNEFSPELRENLTPPDLSTPPDNLPYVYVVIAKKK